jgi:hypothetical protein
MLHAFSALALLFGVVGLVARAADTNTAAFWAFQPLSHPAVPADPSTPGKAGHPIDAFVHEKLRAAGLHPAPAADRVTLLRRLSFDLIGLPPTPEELAAFERDHQPGAVARCIDRLLASPHFGERWARHWLDVVRFGESQGFEYDRIRDNAWRYRDYVIRTFNTDKPYTQFIREQIAGDVLEPVTQEGIVATGFLVGGPWDQAGNSSSSASLRATVREAEMEDIVGTVGQTFLGVTLNCARCHNHKFDPIPQRDYYRIKAVFDGVHHGDRSILSPSDVAARKQRRSGLESVRTQLVTELIALDRDATARVQQKTKKPGSNAASPAPIPEPRLRWDFAQPLSPAQGRLQGGATVSNGRLVLNGRDAVLVSEPIPAALAEKTLEAWVRVADLNQQGGGVVSLESPDGSRFDAIVFGERDARHWMAGSEGFARYQALDAPAETAGPTETLHLVLTQARDGTLTLYRNAVIQGAPWRPASGPSPLATASPTRILIGSRHTGGGQAFFKGEIEAVRVYDRALSAAEVSASFQSGAGATAVPLAQRLAALSAAEQQKYHALTDRIALIEREQRDLDVNPQGYAANVSQPGPTHIFQRGEPDKVRDAVLPGALSAVAGVSPELGLAADSPEAERRRRFADWVASPANPLTARAIVNRVWHYHFHRGLSGTPNDLGRMGDTPSHPELLDWLAGWFVDPQGGNWSLKKLHRLILTSETWQQASSPVPPDAVARDADNRLLWRFTPRRLEAEETRDALLALGGELNPTMGGPGFRAFRHVGNGGQNEYFSADLPGSEFSRRTIYRVSVHSARDPLLDALDCPELSTRTAVRPNTTTPLQALSLMNNSMVVRQADRLAARARSATHDRMEPAIEWMWRRVLGRPPQKKERQEALRLARDQDLAQVAWVLLNSNEFIFVR